MVPVVQIPAKPRASTSKLRADPPVKSRTTAEKQTSRSVSTTKPSPVSRRRQLDSDSVSPPPLRVQSSKTVKSPAERPRARPSAPSSNSKPSASDLSRREKRREAPPPYEAIHRSSKGRQENSAESRPALQPVKRSKVEAVDSASDSSTTSPAKVPTTSSRKPEIERPQAVSSALAPALVAPAPSKKSKKTKRLPSPSDSENDSDSDAIPVTKETLEMATASSYAASKISVESREVSVDIRRQAQPHETEIHEAEREPAPSKLKTRQLTKSASPVRSQIPTSASSSRRRRLPSPKDMDSDSEDAAPPSGPSITRQIRQELHDRPAPRKRSSPCRPSSRVLASPSDDEGLIQSTSQELDGRPRESPVQRRALLEELLPSPARPTSPKGKQRAHQSPPEHTSAATAPRRSQSPPIQISRRDSFSPSEPPESYIGASAQIYIERTTMMRVAPQASSSALTGPEMRNHSSRSPGPTGISGKNDQERTHEWQHSMERQKTRSPSLKAAYVASRDGSEISDAQQSSSLKARKTTAPPTLAAEQASPAYEENCERSRQSLFAASQSPQPQPVFQRLTRSSSDEGESGDEAAAVKSALTLPKRTSASPIRRKHRKPEQPGRIRSPVSPERYYPNTTVSIEPYHDALLHQHGDTAGEKEPVEVGAASEMHVDVHDNLSPLRSSRQHSSDLEPAEDIPVPAYKSPAPQVSHIGFLFLRITY